MATNNVQPNSANNKKESTIPMKEILPKADTQNEKPQQDASKATKGDKVQAEEDSSLKGEKRKREEDQQRTESNVEEAKDLPTKSEEKEKTKQNVVEPKAISANEKGDQVEKEPLTKKSKNDQAEKVEEKTNLGETKPAVGSQQWTRLMKKKKKKSPPHRLQTWPICL